MPTSFVRLAGRHVAYVTYFLWPGISEPANHDEVIQRMIHEFPAKTL